MEDVLSLIGSVLDGGWKMLTEIDIPGLGFSFGALFVGILLASFGFRVLAFALGWSFGVEDVGWFTDPMRPRLFRSYGGASGGYHVRISDARKNDEF